jgi:hypothetical protein
MFRFGDPGGRLYAALGTSNANLLALWTTLTIGASTPSIVAGGGRFAGSCLRFAVINGVNFINAAKTLDSQSTWGVAYAMKLSSLPTGGRIQLLTFEDAGQVQVALYLNTDGTLQVERGGGIGGSAGGNLIGSASSASLSVNVWTHLEFKTTINNTTGSIELRKNGAPIIPPTTGLNTRATANNSANAVRIGFPGNPTGNATFAPNMDLDDIIFWDAQSTDANGLADIHDFIGDSRLLWVLPTGAGTTTQFAPSAGSNFSCVNEAAPDGDTSFVSDATVGDIDTYPVADLPAGITGVKSMAVCHFAKKSDASARSIVAEIRSGGTNYVHATPVFLGTNYLYDFSNWGSDPSTSAAWTIAGINAIEVGQKVAS